VIKCRLVTLAVGLLAAAPLSAQQSDLAAVCAQAPSGQAQSTCYAVAQAVESAQPQVGMVIAGGNPVLGAAGRGGLRIGTLPDVDLTARVNLVFMRLPDILAAGAGTTAQRLNQTLGIPAPALAGSAAIAVFPGFRLAPGIGGIGSVDVLGSAAWLPFRALGISGFEVGTPDAAWGLGARVGLLRESFVLPGASVSLMRRSLGRVGFGEVCRGQEVLFPMTADTECIGPGDAGEFAFDLTNWSARAVVGKRLFGAGLAAGVGYDRYNSDVQAAFRYPEAVPGTAYVRRPELDELNSTRWSVFGNLSYTFLLASLAFEAGWQQGESPVPGFGRDAQFDPRDGSYFGSAGLRLAF
jgi:hypothetical protein